VKGSTKKKKSKGIKTKAKSKGGLWENKHPSLLKILIWAILERKTENVNRQLQILNHLVVSQPCATTTSALLPDAAPALTV